VNGAGVTLDVEVEVAPLPGPTTEGAVVVAVEFPNENGAEEDVETADALVDNVDAVSEVVAAVELVEEEEDEEEDVDEDEDEDEELDDEDPAVRLNCPLCAKIPVFSAEVLMKLIWNACPVRDPNDPAAMVYLSSEVAMLVAKVFVTVGYEAKFTISMVTFSGSVETDFQMMGIEDEVE